MRGTLFSHGLAFVAASLSLPSLSQGAISVGLLGITENFAATIPPKLAATPGDALWTWTTSSGAAGMPGAGANTTITDTAGLDAAVAPLVGADVDLDIADTAAVGTSQSTQRNSNNANLQTNPTGNAFTITMATFQNTSAVPYAGVAVAYTHAALNTPNETEVAGFRGYFSTDGTTWTNVDGFNTAPPDVATPSFINAIVNFPGPVAPGALFHLLWADDNMNGGTEGQYTFDDFSLNPVPIPEPSLAAFGLLGLTGLLARRRR